MDNEREYWENAHKRMLQEGILYHGTSSHFLNGILENGITPTTRPEFFDINELQRFKDIAERVGYRTLPWLEKDNIGGNISLTYNKSRAEFYARYGVGETGTQIIDASKSVTPIIGEVLSGKCGDAITAFHGKTQPVGLMNAQVTEEDRDFILMLGKKYKSLKESAKPHVIHIGADCPAIPLDWLKDANLFRQKIRSSRYPNWEWLMGNGRMNMQNLDYITQTIEPKYFREVEALVD